MKKPLVSIIITNYNYALFVSKAISSAKNQTYSNLELIIIDDGSKDDSDNVIKKSLSKFKKGDMPVTYFSQKNQGIVNTRNKGVRLAKGDYLAFLDADDYFNPEYIEKMLELALASKADVVYPDWKLINLHTKHSFFAHFAEFSKEQLVKQTLHVTAESLIKKSALNGFEFRSKHIAEDWELFLRLAFSGKKIVHAEKIYINYVIGKDSRSSSVKSPEIKAGQDLKEYVAILKRLKEEYPAEKFDPEDLYVEKYKEEFAERERSHQKIIKLDEIVEQLNQTIRARDNLLNNIYSSASYKIALRATYPIRKISQKLRK